MTANVCFAVVLWLGLCLGSFATALSYRLPRGLSIVKSKRSACPACGNALGIVDLVPVFSWLWLKGKCRRCKANIGLRYPLIELATLGLCLSFHAAYGCVPQMWVLLALAPVLIAIIDIDLHHKIIPDSLNLAVVFLGVAAFLLDAPSVDGVITALEGAALYAGSALALRLAFTHIMKREPMGLGDVKFFGAAGFWLGTDLDAAALFMILSGGAGTLLALVWRKCAGEREFPFGPALVLAFALIVILRTPFLAAAHYPS